MTRREWFAVVCLASICTSGTAEDLENLKGRYMGASIEQDRATLRCLTAEDVTGQQGPCALVVRDPVHVSRGLPSRDEADEARARTMGRVAMHRRASGLAGQHVLLSAPLLALGLILGINLGLTLIHSAEEFKGRLWGYFGASAGIRVLAWLGILTFSIGLTLILWAIGLIGIGGGLSVWIGPNRWTDAWAIAAIGALIGGRVADGVFSHLRLQDRKSVV